MKKLLFSLFTMVVFFSMAGGMPAMHELFGSEWGSAVSGYAKSSPGAVAEHIQGV